MKNLKKAVCSVLAVGMVVSCFSGCGGKKSAGGKNEVEYTTWLNAGEDTPVIDSFMKENADVKVKVEILDGAKYEQLMLPRMMSGDAPDLMMMQGGMFLNYKKEGWLSDISETEISKKIKPKQDLVDYLSKDGKIYGAAIAESYTAHPMYYNKKIFEKLQIEIPKTEKEFFEVCEKLKSNGIDPMVFGGADSWTIDGPFAAPIASMENLAKDVGYSDKIAKGELKYSQVYGNTLKNLEKMVKNGYIAKSSSTMKYEQSVQYFADGKAAMLSQGPWLVDLEQITTADKNNFELSSFLYPVGVRDESGKMHQSTGVDRVLCVMKDVAPKDESFKLFNYFVSEPVLLDYLERQNLNVAIPGLVTKKDPVFEGFYKDLLDANKVVTHRITTKYKLPTASQTAKTQAYQNILSGSTAESEMKKLDDIFEKNKDKVELR